MTTNAVVYEAYALIACRAREGRRAALAFLDHVRATEVRIERVRRHDDDRAVAILRRHDDKSFSFCDALSFVVMERLEIPEAIAFDRHFRQYGRITTLEG